MMRTETGPADLQLLTGRAAELEEGLQRYAARARAIVLAGLGDSTPVSLVALPAGVEDLISRLDQEHREVLWPAVNDLAAEVYALGVAVGLRLRLPADVAESRGAE